MLASAKGSQPGRVHRTKSLLATHRHQRAAHRHRIRRGDGEAGGRTLPRSGEVDNSGPRQPQHPHPNRALRGVRAPRSTGIARKLEFHYTPKRASGLNQAEVEFSMLCGECMGRAHPRRRDVRKGARSVGTRTQREGSNGGVAL